MKNAKFGLNVKYIKKNRPGNMDDNSQKWAMILRMFVAYVDTIDI